MDGSEGMHSLQKQQRLCKWICVLSEEFSMMTCLPDTPSDHRPLAALPPTVIPKPRRHGKQGISRRHYPGHSEV